MNVIVPLWPEMVYRFERIPRPDQRSILQYMEPWLHNVELLDYSPHPHLINQCDLREETTPPESTNPVLSGSGWGSVDGTTVVLHNLLYITAKVHCRCGHSDSLGHHLHESGSRHLRAIIYVASSGQCIMMEGY